MKKFNLQLFAAEPNTITTQQFSINPREVDFVPPSNRQIPRWIPKKRHPQSRLWF